MPIIVLISSMAFAADNNPSVVFEKGKVDVPDINVMDQSILALEESLADAVTPEDFENLREQVANIPLPKTDPRVKKILGVLNSMPTPEEMRAAVNDVTTLDARVDALENHANNADDIVGALGGVEGAVKGVGDEMKNLGDAIRDQEPPTVNVTVPVPTVNVACTSTPKSPCSDDTSRRPHRPVFVELTLGGGGISYVGTITVEPNGARLSEPGPAGGFAKFALEVGWQSYGNHGNVEAGLRASFDPRFGDGLAGSGVVVVGFSPSDHLLGDVHGGIALDALRPGAQATIGAGITAYFDRSRHFGLEVEGDMGSYKSGSLSGGLVLRY